MKKNVMYSCQKCSHRTLQFTHRCFECGEIGSMVKEIQEKRLENKSRVLKSTQNPWEDSRFILLSQSLKGEEKQRISCGIKEVDQVLGGGFVWGSAILLGGEPGIGKSTLVLQIAARMEEMEKEEQLKETNQDPKLQKNNLPSESDEKNRTSKKKVIYLSGEESAYQIGLRAKRLGIENQEIELLCQNDMDIIEEEILSLGEGKVSLLIVDSIQTLKKEAIGSLPGTINQIKYASSRLIEWGKKNNVILLFIAHVTKEGVIAGPKILEHMVDTVLYFEQMSHEIRALRSYKNRFGSVNEIGFFSMEEEGLKEIHDFETLFLTDRQEDLLPSGVVVAPLFEGSRVLLIEIQALVVPSKTNSFRVFSDRIDTNRILRVIAVLEKNLQMSFSFCDIYINVAGGIKASEVAIDLALASALVSALKNWRLKAHTAVIGEISLAGELRDVSHRAQREKIVREMKLGELVGPRAVSLQSGKQKKDPLEESSLILQKNFGTLKQALKYLFKEYRTASAEKRDQNNEEL